MSWHFTLHGRHPVVVVYAPPERSRGVSPALLPLLLPLTTRLRSECLSAPQRRITSESFPSPPATSPPTQAIPLSEVPCAAAQTHARHAHTNASPREPQPFSARCSRPASRLHHP